MLGMAFSCVPLSRLSNPKNRRCYRQGVAFTILAISPSSTIFILHFIFVRSGRAFILSYTLLDRLGSLFRHKGRGHKGREHKGREHVPRYVIGPRWGEYI